MDNLFFESYQDVIDQQNGRVKYTYKVVNPETKEVIGTFSSSSQAYYKCQNYGREHLLTPMDQVLVNPVTNEEIVQFRYIVANDRNGNPRLWTREVYDRMQSNAKKYDAINQARSERRTSSADLRSKILAINEEANKKIMELKEQINQIRAEATAKINALRNPIDTETPNTEIPEVQVDQTETPTED